MAIAEAEIMPGPLWNEEQHASFVERLKNSTKAVMVIAAYQHSKGRTVEIPPLVISPNPSENVRNTDSGDLYVVVRHKMEVKHRKRQFTCRDDWPDPHVFVSNVGTVDRANGSVSSYVIVNLPMTHAAIIHRSTKEHWYIRENQPSNTTEPERVYCCPIEHVEFVELA